MKGDTYTLTRSYDPLTEPYVDLIELEYAACLRQLFKPQAVAYKPIQATHLQHHQKSSQPSIRRPRSPPSHFCSIKALSFFFSSESFELYFFVQAWSPVLQETFDGCVLLNYAQINLCLKVQLPFLFLPPVPLILLLPLACIMNNLDLCVCCNMYFHCFIISLPILNKPGVMNRIIFFWRIRIRPF